MSEQGRRIADRYELVAPLGEGGMGEVWRALDTRLGRQVALKLLSRKSLGSEVARTRLIREARATAALEHEGIIRVYDVGETDDGGAFLVMELVRGRTLRAELDAGALSPGRQAAIIIAAARALHVAHQAGIVHRDIKPDNIMIRDDGRALVLDFGVAKPVSTDLLAHAETVPGVTTNRSLTGAGQLVGTPAYLAPEQARGTKVSPATDQFALAVTAYECFTGRLPWRGDGIIEIVASILRDEPEPLSAPAEAAAEMNGVLARALRKDPRERFPDMAAFADALEDITAALHDTGSGASTVSASLATPSTHARHTASPGAAPVPPKPRRWLAAAIALGVLATAGVAAWQRKLAAPVIPPPRAATERVVACPPFTVTGVDAVWLGAAGAALACERAQIAYGGDDARTLVAAELLEASAVLEQPPQPEILESPKARTDSIAAAKARAVPWLDGKIEKQSFGYVISIVLRGPDDRELARGEGRAAELFEAVRDAVTPILRAQPPTQAELAALRQNLDVDSVEDAMTLLDVRTAILIEDLVSLKQACGAAAARPLSPRAGYFVRAACARKLRTGKLSDAPPPIDEGSPSALITSVLAHGTAGGPSAVKERASRLEKAQAATTSPELAARLAAAAAETYNLVGDERGGHLCRVALQRSPKAFDWRTSAWHRLAFSSDSSAVHSAISIWHPWEPVAQSFARDSVEGKSAEAALRHAWRAYLLSQRGVYASSYGEQLLQQGQVETARSLAEQTDDDSLRVSVLLAEAKYALAMKTVAKRLAELPATDERAALAFSLADQGTTAARTLGRKNASVDMVLDKWVLSEPHHVVDAVVPVMALVSTCLFAEAPTAKRCIGRLEQLREGGRLPTVFAAFDTVLAGAARFVVEDYVGAAKIWRTLLRSAGSIEDPLREVIATAFDRAGQPELGDEIDSPALVVDPLRAPTLAWVRGAKRAQKRGDTERARKLATAVVEKWRFADEDIPAVAEMRALLATLPH